MFCKMRGIAHQQRSLLCGIGWLVGRVVVGLFY